MIFINQKIDNIYGRKIGSGTCKKQLKLLNHKQKKNASLEFNQKFVTFLECIKHFRVEIFLKELEELQCFENIKEDIRSHCQEEVDDYVEILDYYFNIFKLF